MTIEELEKEIERVQLDIQLNQLDEDHDDKLEKEMLIPKLESEIARVEAMMKAQEEESAPVSSGDSLVDDALDVAGEFAQGAHRGVAQMADFFSAPVRVAGNIAMPGAFPRLEDKLVEGGVLGNDYMEKGMARDAVRGAGATVPAAAGFVPVTRAAGNTSSVLQDIAGFGMSTDDAATAAYKTSMAAAKQADDVALKAPKTDGEIWEAAKASRNRQLVDGNRARFEKAEEAAKQFDDDLEKIGSSDDALEEAMTPIDTVSLKQVINDLTDQGVDGANALKVIGKKGGLRFPDYTMDDLAAMDKQFTKADGTGTNPGWFSKTFTPVADMISKHVDSKVGGVYERANETAMRASTALVRNYAEPMKRVIRAVDQRPELNKLFLDLHTKPENLAKLQTFIRDNIGTDDLKAFNKFIAFSQSRVAEANKRIFKPGAFKQDDLYLHTNKRPVKTHSMKESVGRFGSSDSSKVDAIQDRTRQLTDDMAPEDVAQYDNVLVSHLKYLAEQEQLLEMQKHFNLRPSMAERDGFNEFFAEVSKKLNRDGIDLDRAEGAAEIMRQAYEGGRKSPPPLMRAFMSGSYAGTLAQFKTSALNLHDIFVSMHTNGVRPTLKAAVQSNKQVFGKSLEELGIGDAQSTGEFVNNLDNLVSNPSALDKFAKGSRDVTEASMKWSAFKAMDKIGKGVVLRAAVNKMRDAAKKGNLHREFNDIASKEELIKVRKYLEEGTELSDMPKASADIIEEMAFTALGKQQLISQAGRPLNYLKVPYARPLYALTGFAIKQRAMVARQMRDAKGPAQKAAVLARYAVFAGGGYGLVNQSREAIFKREEPTPEGFMIDVAEQVAAMATLNKMGDAYSAESFADDPVKFLMTAWLPPTGLQGAAAQSLVSAFDAMLFEGEWDDAIVEKFPMMGDFYKYYWKDE